MYSKHLLLTVFLVALSFVSFASDFYITTTDLNVRTGEGRNFPVAFTLQKGIEVEVIGERGGWFMIGYLGDTGYVSSKYLVFTRTGSVAPTQSFKLMLPTLLFIGGLAALGWVGYLIFISAKNRKLTKTITSPDRGEWSERNLGVKLLDFGIPAEAIFHDLYLKKRSGKFSQIDLVAVTSIGILVFEIKDYSGWIFGSGNQLYWTKVLAYGRQKYRFQNPIIQNNNHIAELKKQLPQIVNVPFYSIIVFYGDCVLKEINFVPKGTFLVKDKRVSDVLNLIFKENMPVSYTNESEIFRLLKEGVVNGGIVDNQIQHKNNIEDMLGKDRIFDN
jgi:hypothetical protein